MQRLSTTEWKSRSRRHRDRLLPFADERLNRMARHVKHPVHDFLFDYYSFRPAHLLRWSPGPGILLEGAETGDIPWKEFSASADGLILRVEDFPQHRRDYIDWAQDYLETIAERPPALGCFGLHEWAMVYRESQVRHSKTPLRLAPAAIARVVETDGVRCSHYDAYRFFTPAAVPLNRTPLARKTTTENDQKGCIHVTMDLYRFAYKIAPWCAGELMADAFLLAWEARQLDMRASPYDLRGFGMAPILIETRTGREEYVQAQIELAQKGEPIRARLIDQYRQLKTAVAQNEVDRKLPIPRAGL